MYVMVSSQLDIAHVVGVLSRYRSTVGKENYSVVKRVFGYMRDTTKYVICYQRKPEIEREFIVHDFVDVD
jgi:hypothetical protein